MHAGILFPLFTLAASRPPARGRAAHLEPKLALMSVYYVFTPRGHYMAARSCLALRLSRTRGDGLPHAGARGGTGLLRAGLPLLPYPAGGPPLAATCHRCTLRTHHASSLCSFLQCADLTSTSAGKPSAKASEATSEPHRRVLEDDKSVHTP